MRNFWKKLIEIRHSLHSDPEVSGQETRTAEKIVNYLKRIGVNRIYENIGGKGVLAVIEGSKPGKNLLFRAELDALPLREENEIAYKSKNKRVAHLCGHDGHMAILLGIAELIYRKRNEMSGKTILLFQPAEETAQGAVAVLADKNFKEIKVDQAFALHNIPGYALGAVLIRNGCFALASRGVIIRLIGATSHAGEPLNGRSPTLAMTRIINEIILLPKRYLPLSTDALTTVVYARLGEVAFGTSPGYAEIMATFRSGKEQEMKILIQEVERLIKGQAKLYRLDSEIEHTEIFPVTKNDNRIVEIVKRAAKKISNEIIQLEAPFPWSEDFGYFSRKFPSVLFGFGAGKDHPSLHNPDYDFPDQIIEPAVKMLYQICLEVL